jgi:hypothetical protein
MKWTDIKENGIFVGGHRKNGTTLLPAMLDGHPDLFVYPYETHFWFAFYPIYTEGNYTIEEKKERVKDFIFGSLKQTVKKWMKLDEKDLNFSYEKLNEVFDSKITNSSKTAKDFFDAIIFSVREMLPDKNYPTHKMWLEKTTSSDIYINEIFKMYPNSKFIHILRDPRDSWAVIKNGWDKHYKTQYDSIERLFRSVIDRNYLDQRMAIENPQIYGKNKYMVLKYEDLVMEPESTIKDVCSFIGMDYNLVNIEPTFCGIPWEGNSLADIRYKTVATNRIGIYNKLPMEEIKVLEYYFREYMLKFGYKPMFKQLECVDAVREHYKWFNYNQPYSMKPLRADYRHLETANLSQKRCAT